LRRKGCFGKALISRVRAMDEAHSAPSETPRKETAMNRSSKTLALIAVTLASSLATAQTLPARTRADVVAELRAAQASGELQAERLQAEGVGYLLGTPAQRKASTASAAASAPKPDARANTVGP
jgi:hypothetical protein